MSDINLSPYTAEAAAIERRRKMAEVLQAQSMAPLETDKMAGGWVVPVSPYAGLAKMLQGYNAGAANRQADQDMKDLYGRQQEDSRSDMSAMVKALSGQAAQPERAPVLDPQETQQMADQGSPMAPNIPAVAARAPGRIDPSVMDSMKTPQGQQMAMAQILAQLGPKALIHIKEGETVGRQNDAGGIDTLITGPKVPKFHVVGGNLVPEPTAPNAQVLPAFTAPKTDKDESQKLTDMLIAGGIDPASPQGQQMYRSMASKMATHQPSASNNVTIKQEGAEAGAVGKNFGEEFSTLQKGGVAANTKLANLDRMESLLNGVKTGKLTPMGTEVAALADSLGIKIDKNLGNKQAAEALSNGIALELRSPSGGAGMPGAMSDKDREFLVSMTPGLAKTPEGNRLIIETARKLAKRDQQVAKLAREYRQKTGHMDEGFYNQLQEFSDKNPLFSAPKVDIHSEAEAIINGKR